MTLTALRISGPGSMDEGQPPQPGIKIHVRCALNEIGIVLGGDLGRDFDVTVIDYADLHPRMRKLVSPVQIRSPTHPVTSSAHLPGIRSHGFKQAAGARYRAGPAASSRLYQAWPPCRTPKGRI